MTVATLDELLGPKPKEHKDLVKYGYREDTIAGRKHYVGRDEVGRAVIGPVRHGRGWLNALRRKKRKPVVLPSAPERALKVIIDHKAVMAAAKKAQQFDQQMKMQEGVRTVDFSKLTEGISKAFPTPPPAPQPSRVTRVRQWFTDKWYDDEWHQGARNTAGTILLWGFTLFAFVVFSKGLAWIVTL